MFRTMLFLHWFGFVIWIGAALAMMVGSIAARKEERAALAVFARLQAAITRILVGPGAAITLLTGVILTFQMYQAYADAAPSIWLMVMQGAGLVAAVLVLVITVPTSARLARIDPNGPAAAVFDALRMRQRIFSSIAGTLALLALLAGVLMRFRG